MSALAATQIPKPADEQAFERGSVVLFRCLLGDPNVSRHGRRGQRQNGVDLVGIRNGDPTHLVGVQCKLKGAGHELSEKEVRDELDNALTFNPQLREYFIVTTSPDDVDLQQLARELAVDLMAKGRRLLIHVWGWNTLEERISEHAAARKAFDPSHGVFSEQILDKVTEGVGLQVSFQTDFAVGFSTINSSLARIEAALPALPGDATVVANALEAHLDAEIDEFRDLANAGKPRTALPLLERLLDRVAFSASGRILFRIKANIASCLLALGDDSKATQVLADAYDHAPTEPKAVANKALSLLLQGNWRELLEFGKVALRADPTNDGVAGYLVQAARFDGTIEEPLALLPDHVKTSAPVAIGRILFLQHRGRGLDWWQAAREAVATHPDDPLTRQFAAEADLDQILRDPQFQQTGLFRPGERGRISAAADLLLALWDKARSGEASVRPEHIALCSNLVVAFFALEDLTRVVEIARQGLAIAPDDRDLVGRAMAAAIDGRNDDLARELLPKLPPGPEAVILAFRFYAQHNDWAKVAEICRAHAGEIPEVERTLVMTAARLAELKTDTGEDAEAQLRAVVANVSCDPRASIVAADFSMMLGHETIAEEAYQNALRKVDADSHIAPRLMVAMHAAKRNDWKSVADLLDGHVGEECDSHELRTLATALVNDQPVRKRAIRFFERLPQSIGTLPFYLHAAGLMHFNRGALKQAEASLRRAIDSSPSLTNYLALFAILRRTEQAEKIRPILETLDLATLQGTPGQKMYLAQALHMAGQKERALAFAYETLTHAPNDPDAALRYFGLLMADPDSRVIPPITRVGVDAWVRLEGVNGETFRFIIEDSVDRPADGILNPKHPIAAAAIGLEVNACFEQRKAVGGDTTWRVAEIKHKYLHALHDVMENFQTRFPESKGIYKFSIREGDIQPALDEVRRASEANRQLADLYLIQHLPMAVAAAALGGDAISFADYVRTLDRNIEVCVGTEPERLAALDVIVRQRECGAVLDTYTAWTAATMDILDVLAAVFGRLTVPQSALDELRIIHEKDARPAERAMTIAWHNGQYFRQEFTKEDIEARHRFIGEQIQKIESVCQVAPNAAPDAPTEIAVLLTESFGSHILDAANLAADGYVLLAEDMYYRQITEGAVAARGTWLQPVLAFARDQGMISRERYADAAVKLAWRRHSHLSLDPETLSNVLHADNTETLDRFRPVTAFIATKNADMRSHMTVASTFLGGLWSGKDVMPLKAMRATALLLDRLTAHHAVDWPFALAFVKQGADWRLQQYVDSWVIGHFLPIGKLAAAEQDLIGFQAALHHRLSSGKRRLSALASTLWPFGS
ncbi:hypothetical protein K9U39_17930 [Rhodoblastus acidophilus]|uniref:PIN domain-containing protein n=1 Tax=Candidatus Rhodoblastus alkanivorans TaxID=2954117 RepID=A0ABS9Z529_9HYPH|nr:hypothetical protein [Candidatus Rhodoblastus alkanivorans]MCI4679003.1 hypothetical protein [Candidatus Rhodoblastus alkanivorans]MCI4681742.1 hypothetical protein [Candidatus Rhodoblastus alkanivorans]MDI4642791.1 hypothetical protein [Rhodoblastus acidophilus]